LAENKKENDEKVRIYNEVLKWIHDNDAHFKRNCKKLYDLKNLERIKRFANAPIDYIEERIELNKEVLKSYHKLHQTILFTILSGFYFYVLILLIQSCLMPLLSRFTIYDFILLMIKGELAIWSLIIWGCIGLIILWGARNGRILKYSGLLKVILDSEIEIYYLSKIKEYRNSIKCPNCGKRIPKDTIFCDQCGNEIK